MKNYIIIPDLHGQYNTLIKMLKEFVTIENGIIQPNEYKIILLGDYIDKSDKKQQIKMIKFIHANLHMLTIILGNHEEKTYKYLKGQLNHKLGRAYDFFRIAEENKDIKEKFIEIVKKQVVFYEDENVYCNHSPCLNVHMEEETTELTQYKYRSKKNSESEESYSEFIEVFFSGILNNKCIGKYHFFGHLGLSIPLVNNKQVWLDTRDIKDIHFAIIKDGELSFTNHELNKSEIQLENDVGKNIDFISERLQIRLDC